MRQLRSAKSVLPPLDLTKAGLVASATFGKPNSSDFIPSASRSVELGYFPHLLRSAGGPTPSSSRLALHNEARAFPASASATTDQRFIRKETLYTDAYDKGLASPEKRKKHTCGYQQLEVLREKLVKLEPYNGATQNESDTLADSYAKTATLSVPTTSLTPTSALPSKADSKLSAKAEEMEGMEPFLITPEFVFSIEDTWDGISETSLIYEGQTIPVDLTLENKLEEEQNLYQFVRGRPQQNFRDVKKEIF